MLDSVGQMDGLERLICVVVGCDSPIGAADAASATATEGADGVESRSALYRAVTRAHLAVLVVNELIPGGIYSYGPHSHGRM